MRKSIVRAAPGPRNVRGVDGSRRLADSKGRLKVLAVASTGPSGKIARSSRRLTLALGTATKKR